MTKLAIQGGNPVRDTPLHLAEPIIGEEEISAVTKVLRSKWIREGEKVKEFEEKFSEYIGSKYAVAVSSGTAALHTAYATCGIREGEEVIVPSFTHISTVNAVLYIGAIPVFAEIDPNTYTIHPNDVENKITNKARAIIVVHWAGHPADMETLVDIAKRHNLIVIEDACQATGALYHSKKVGSFGDTACFSFYPSKIITTGEGGMIVTNSKEIAEKAKLFRNYGQSWERRFTHTILGYNYRMTELQAAMGIVQLDRIEDTIKRKNEVAFRLSDQLQKIKGISPPVLRNDIRHTFMHYMIKVNEKDFGKARDFIVEALNAENIQSRVYIPPVHLQPYYKEKFKYGEGLLPITENVAKKVLTLPCSPTMKDSDIKDIVEAIYKIIK